jgi:hypothetical protein
MIEEIKLSELYTIYKTKYSWKYSKEDILLKYNKNYNLFGQLDVNTSPIFLNCDEFDSVFKIVFDVTKKLSKGGNDSMSKKWFYIQKNENTFEKYHAHKFVDAKQNIDVLNEWNFCFYLSIPNDLIDDEGKLFFMDENEIEHPISPTEGDIIIFPANLKHKPKLSPNSKGTRISMCGNIAFNLQRYVRTPTII